MPSHLLVKRDGQIFINAAGGDSQEIVIRRAARVALKKNTFVNYQVINKKEEYRPLNLIEAKKVMTQKAWIEEMRDPLSDPLTSREAEKLLTPKTRKRIITELKRERVGLHSQCLALDKEIKKVAKILNV
ncbi:MAG: hypothetical protein AAB461_00600 [Patescibacteria group bacterium]